MTSRERVKLALNHKQPDRAPFDFGSGLATGINVYELIELRKAYGLEERLIRVFEPFMFLGELDDDLIEKVQTDFLGIVSPISLLGYQNKDWKEWTTPKGIKVLVGKGFTYTVGEDGMVYLFAKSNVMTKPAARMPACGVYFDHTDRQGDLTDHVFDARADYAGQYTEPYSDLELRHFEEQTDYLYKHTDKALVFNFGMGGFGDFFHIPGPSLEEPRGIRNLETWLMAPYEHPEYVKEIFQMQYEVALEDLKLAYQAMGDRIEVVAVSGTDFGTQLGPMVSVDLYREFFKPLHTKLHDWIHKNTPWKVFFHSCGSVHHFFDDFIEAGVDCINPVQVSAAGMDPQTLKDKFGNKLVFWGGTVDPQSTMVNGTPEEVYETAKKNIGIFNKNGGFIASHIHNVQPYVPVENLTAFIDACTGR